MIPAKAPSKKFLRWATAMARIARLPATLKPSPARPFNREQEMARRRRQMAVHGKNYWCAIYEDAIRQGKEP